MGFDLERSLRVWSRSTPSAGSCQHKRRSTDGRHSAVPVSRCVRCPGMIMYTPLCTRVSKLFEATVSVSRTSRAASDCRRSRERHFYGP